VTFVTLAVAVDDLASTVFAWGRWLSILVIFLALVYRSRHRIRWRPFSVEVGLIIAAYWVYFFVRGITEGDAQLAIGNGWDVVEFERRLGIFWEGDLQRWFLPNHLMVSLFNWVYVWGHWPVIVSTGAWMVIKKPEVYRRYRNAFLLSGGIGLLIFATYPVAPPRFLDLGLIDTVSEHSASYRVLQPATLTNQYAAVPSLHFGWNLLIGILWFREMPWRVGRALGVVLPAMMCLAIVVTANHYIVDAAAGAAVALVGLALSVHGRRIVAAALGLPQAEEAPARE
jgi:hypothetical protein